MPSDPVANMVVLAADDNVGIATRDIAAGEAARDVHGREVVAREPIPQGHKIALTALGPERTVMRFGVPVGRTTAPVERGAWVHVHNVASQYLTNDQDHYE